MKLWDKTLKKMYYRRVPYKMQDWGFRLRGKEKKQRKNTKVQKYKRRMMQKQTFLFQLHRNSDKGKFFMGSTEFDKSFSQRCQYCMQ